MLSVILLYFLVICSGVAHRGGNARQVFFWKFASFRIPNSPTICYENGLEISQLSKEVQFNRCESTDNGSYGSRKCGNHANRSFRSLP